MLLALTALNGEWGGILAKFNWPTFYLWSAWIRNNDWKIQRKHAIVLTFSFYLKQEKHFCYEFILYLRVPKYENTHFRFLFFLLYYNSIVLGLPTILTHCIDWHIVKIFVRIRNQILFILKKMFKFKFSFRLWLLESKLD